MIYISQEKEWHQNPEFYDLLQLHNIFLKLINLIMSTHSITHNAITTMTLPKSKANVY